ncbi:MAG: hypothetical protein ACFB0B_02730 [Thermonemataceae bacterium]
MKKVTYIFFLLGLLMLISPEINAQCVMCKAAVESSDKIEAYTKGINSGILYMAVFPYLLLSVVGFIWYKNHKKFKAAQEARRQARKQLKASLKSS